MGDGRHLYVDTRAFIKVGDKYIFKGYTYQGTYEYDDINCELNIIPELSRPFPWSSIDYYGGVAVGEEYVVFPPYYENKYVTVLDLLKKEYMYFKIEANCAYKTAITVNDNIYFIPETSLELNDLVKFNMNSGNVTEYRIEGLENSGESIQCFSSSICRVGNKIYLPCTTSGKICEIDFGWDKARVIQIPGVDCCISSINYENSKYWFTGDSDAIYVGDFDKIKKIELEECSSNKLWKFRFSSAKRIGNYLYYSPVYYNWCIRINICTDVYEKVFEIENDNVVWEIFELGKNRLYATSSGVERKCVQKNN